MADSTQFVTLKSGVSLEKCQITTICRYGVEMTNTTFDDGRVPAWSQADVLRKAREDAGLTQRELADRLGVSVNTIRRMEGGSRPKRATVMAWSMATGVSYAWLSGAGWASWDLNPEPAVYGYPSVTCGAAA